MRVKRWLALALTLALVLSMASQPALAGELGADQGAASQTEQVSLEESAKSGSEEAEPGESPGTAGTVTGFQAQGPVQRLSFGSDSRPDLSALTAQMPESLLMMVDGAEQSVPVTWYCVGEDYESSERYYFQFSPRWDESRWPVAEGLNVVEQAPYVAVFLTEEEVGAQSAESVELECYNFFVNRMELNSAAACGILANIYNECAFKPNNLQQYYEKKLGYTDESYTEAVDNGTYTNFVKDSAGYGLVQFTWWTLKRDLLAYARQKGTSIGDTQTQLEYLQTSLGTKRTAAMKAFPNTAQGAYDAGKYFCDEYEKPGLKDQPGIRARLARDTFWPKYSSAAALTAPQLVSLTQTAKGVTLAWNSAPGAGRYRVCWKEGEGEWSDLAETDQLSWTDETLTSGTTRTYSVRSLSADGLMASDLDPVGLSITFWRAPEFTAAGNSSQGIRLGWTDEGSPCYLVYRKGQGESAWGAPVCVSECTYTDAQTQSGQSYYYAVRCADQAGAPLSWYNTKKILSLEMPVLTKVSNTSKGIQLRWKTSSGASGYWVCRKPADGKWKKVAILKGGKKAEYTDKSLKKYTGVPCFYTIRAYHGSTLSGYQDPGEPACRLNAPKLSGVKAGKGKLTVKWKKSAGAKGYEVVLVKGKLKKNLVVQGGGTLQAALSDLGKGSWKAAVRSWRQVGERKICSAWSSSKKVKIK